VRSALVESFARHDESRSAQHSLYVMAGAVLDACPEVDNLSIRWPGRLHQPVDLTPFGQQNAGEVYVPVDQTPGFVEARVARAR
jgi:urate oxidase